MSSGYLKIKTQGGNNMAFCPHCGSKIPADSAFCPGCGKKAETTAASAPSAAPSAKPTFIPTAKPGVPGNDLLGSLKTAFNALGNSKVFFISTIVLIILTLIIGSTDMARLITWGGERTISFIDIMKEAQSTDSDESAYGLAIAAIRFGTVLFIAALIMTALPIFIGKGYKKAWLYGNIVAAIYNFVLYIIIYASICSEANDGGIFFEIKIRAAYWFYIIFCLAVVGISAVFAFNLKNSQNSKEVQNFSI